MSKTEESESKGGASKMEEEAKLSMPPPREPFKLTKEVSGNPRMMSIRHFPMEVDQVVLDITAYLEEHAAADGLSEIDPVGEEVLSVLQSEVGCVFPKAVKSLFRKHNGGIRVYDFLTLSDDAVLATIKSYRDSDTWSPRLVPFAKEQYEDNFLVLEFPAAAGPGGSVDPSAAVVKEWCPDDGLTDGEGPAPSAATYLEQYRDKLCSGRFEYVEDVGLVERMATSPKKKTSHK